MPSTVLGTFTHFHLYIFLFNPPKNHVVLAKETLFIEVKVCQILTVSKR